MDHIPVHDTVVLKDTDDAKDTPVRFLTSCHLLVSTKTGKRTFVKFHFSEANKPRD